MSFWGWAIAAAVLVITSSAAAHDSWINEGQYKNSAGMLCCGDNDCGLLDRDAVKEVSGGYAVHGFATINPGSENSRRIRVDQTIPFAESIPSPDGEFWICIWGGARKCFFAGPTGS